MPLTFLKMLFAIFLTLLFLSIILMPLGYIMNLPLMSLMGALLLFGLGLTMLAVDVEVKTGDITTIGYNGSTATNLTTSYNYEAYDFGTWGQSSWSMIILLFATAFFIIFLFKLGD